MGSRTRTQRHVARLSDEQRQARDAMLDRVRGVQLARDSHTGLDDDEVREAAASGIASSGGALPHLDAIQRSFGAHDVTGIRAHVGGAATDASHALGAHAYATGNDVAFAEQPSLALAAHEAAHVVQQRAGVQLSSAVGHAGDAYEQQADAVAARVVAGESAEDLLGPVQRGGGSASVQREEGPPPALNPPPMMDENDAIDLLTDVRGVEIAFRGAHRLSQTIYDAGIMQAKATTAFEENHEAYAQGRAEHIKPLDKGTLETVIGVIVDIASFASGAVAVFDALKSATAVAQSAREVSKMGKGRVAGMKAAKEGLVNNVGEAAKNSLGAIGGMHGMWETHQGDVYAGDGNAHSDTFLPDLNANAIAKASNAIAAVTDANIRSQLVSLATQAEMAENNYRGVKLQLMTNLRLPPKLGRQIDEKLEEAKAWSVRWSAQLALLHAEFMALRAGGAAALADDEQLPLYELIAGWVKNGGKDGARNVKHLYVAKDQARKEVRFADDPYIDRDPSSIRVHPCHAYREHMTHAEYGTLHVQGADEKLTKELRTAGAELAEDLGVGTNENAAVGRGGLRFKISMAMCDALMSLGVAGVATPAVLTFMTDKAKKEFSKDHPGDFLARWQNTPEFEQFYLTALGHEYRWLKNLDGGERETFKAARFAQNEL